MNFVLKVADFGLAASLDTSKDYFRQDQDEAIKLPVKWLAPESINDKVFSEKSDVVNICSYINFMHDQLKYNIHDVKSKFIIHHSGLLV